MHEKVVIPRDFSWFKWGMLKVQQFLMDCPIEYKKNFPITKAHHYMVVTLVHVIQRGRNQTLCLEQMNKWSG